VFARFQLPLAGRLVAGEPRLMDHRRTSEQSEKQVQMFFQAPDSRRDSSSGRPWYLSRG
jgi:hypothetical protein